MISYSANLLDIHWFPKITGITGHVGFRVLATALETGYRVRGVVRRFEQIDLVKNAPSVQTYLKRLEFVVVQDLSKEGAYDEALKGVTHIIHVAAPIPDAAMPVCMKHPSLTASLLVKFVCVR